MQVILIGYGTVGKEVEKVLKEKGVRIDSIIRSRDVLNKDGLNSDTYIFICVPSKETGEGVAHYYRDAFEKGAKIITCEKAFLANHWAEVADYREKIKYSATVGGNSGILDAVSSYKEHIRELSAVINGTLNYVGEKISQGISPDDIYADVTSKGFAEPGAKNLEEVIKAELNDVLCKTAILANHSGLYKKFVKPEDIKLYPYKRGFRCRVVLNKDEIKAGFFEDDGFVYPPGATNVLYINGSKCAEGPGAGGGITAERMFKDFEKLRELK
jgi:homoserine dehydrogenase